MQAPQPIITNCEICGSGSSARHEEKNFFRHDLHNLGISQVMESFIKHSIALSPAATILALELLLHLSYHLERHHTITTAYMMICSMFTQRRNNDPIEGL